LARCRAVVTAEECILFDPLEPTTLNFLKIVRPRLKNAVKAVQRLPDDYGDHSHEAEKTYPFELELLEATLMAAQSKILVAWLAKVMM
jgi:hypothetical protein